MNPRSDPAASTFPPQRGRPESAERGASAGLAPGPLTTRHNTVQPLGHIVSTWVEPKQSTVVLLDVPELSQLQISFVDESTGNPQSVRIRQVLRELESHGEVISPRSFLSTDPASGRISFIGVPGGITFSVETDAHGTFWHRTSAMAGTHVEVVRMHSASWIDLTFVRDSFDPGSTCKWYGQIELWDSVGRLEPLWTESWSVGNGRKVSLCVRGSQSVDLLFLPDVGYPSIPTLRIPAGFPEADDSSRTQRRSLFVPVGDTATPSSR